MSASEKIWTSGGHYWEDPTFKRDKTEYTRSDLIPTAAYVAGLEAAAKRALEEAVADDRDTWFEGLRAALSARPDAPATRTVTVAQLDRWLGCLVSLEIKDEIRAIIGSTDK